MNGKIIFIDDQEDVRSTYGRKLTRIFSNHAEILTLPPEKNLELMLKKLDSIEDKIMYVIDEELTLTGGADYNGAFLIEHIRLTDRRIPIYILTSNSAAIDSHLGNVEFIIDKQDWSANQDNLAERFFRHIDTYNEIKSSQEKRFDELLTKSINTVLSDEEMNEFNALNLNRAKKLINESLISSNDLENLEIVAKKIDELRNKIMGTDNE
ncbi:hypothetical protein [Pantoea sp. Cy-640]|uniref:hypothetical protein n=1 Tax=Pantoea sp. Cy-640 TaxID=2608353 RepID=UPI001419FB87|nr:hypothetical protein [Pantoea sp. Cy-640]NIG16556.1 hypothetical protein [Pantoea sp. Cy-640]